MANFEACKADLADTVKSLVGYLRTAGLVGDSLLDGDGRPATLRDYLDEREEVLHNACLRTYDVSRRLSSL